MTSAFLLSLIYEVFELNNKRINKKSQQDQKGRQEQLPWVPLWQRHYSRKRVKL